MKRAVLTTLTTAFVLAPTIAFAHYRTRRHQRTSTRSYSPDCRHQPCFGDGRRRPSRRPAWWQGLVASAVELCGRHGNCGRSRHDWTPDSVCGVRDRAIDHRSRASSGFSVKLAGRWRHGSCRLLRGVSSLCARGGDVCHSIRTRLRGGLHRRDGIAARIRREPRTVDRPGGRELGPSHRPSWWGRNCAIRHRSPREFPLSNARRAP
jgi:hypothetical protein